jgi:hypothetical protein
MESEAEKPSPKESFEKTGIRRGYTLDDFTTAWAGAPPSLLASTGVGSSGYDATTPMLCFACFTLFNILNMVINNYTLVNPCVPTVVQVQIMNIM